MTHCKKYLDGTTGNARCGVVCLPFNRCRTRSRKISQFKHYITDAPV